MWMRISFRFRQIFLIEATYEIQKMGIWRVEYSSRIYNRIKDLICNFLTMFN